MNTTFSKYGTNEVVARTIVSIDAVSKHGVTLRAYGPTEVVIVDLTESDLRVLSERVLMAKVIRDMVDLGYVVKP